MPERQPVLTTVLTFSTFSSVFIFYRMATSFSLPHSLVLKKTYQAISKHKFLIQEYFCHMPQIQSFRWIFLQFRKKFDVPGHTGETPHATFGRQWS
jgi:hypothetical protein